jgi:hypothetical protein
LNELENRIRIIVHTLHEKAEGKPREISPMARPPSSREVTNEG